MKPDAPILLPDLRNKEEGDKPTNVAQPLPVQARRCRSRLQGGRLRRRARVQHRDGPSGLHRAAQRGRHLQLRRPGDDLLLDPGRLRRALAERAGARDAGRHISRWCRPKSAAASAARPPSTSNRCRCCCRRRPARPVKMVMTRVGSAARERPDLGLEDQSARWARPRTAKSSPRKSGWPTRRARSRARRSARARCASSRPTTSTIFRSTPTTWSSIGPRPRPIARRARPTPPSPPRPMIDELAEKCGIDPIDFRLMNARQGRHAADRRPSLQAHRIHRDARGDQEQPALQVAS